MSVFSGFLWVVMLLLVPVCAGYALCRWFRMPVGLHNCYLTGWLGEWALIQLLSVPMTLLKTGFTPLVWAITSALALLSAAGAFLFFRDRRLRRNGEPGEAKPGWNGADVFALTVLIVGCVCLAVTCAQLQHIDDDDSRYVVMAVDIEHTDRLFLTDYGTGQPLTGFEGTLRHDIFSPWVVCMAYVARMTATPVTVVAHTVLPQAWLLCLISVYWAVAERLFGNKRFEKYAMVFLALLVCVYSGRSSMAAEGYFLRRSWQGKAVVAGIGIPAMVLALTEIPDRERQWRPYLFEYMVTLAMCFMSAMGIILGSILCGAFGLAYGLQHRSLPVALKTWGGLLICLVYVGVMMLRIA